MAEPIQSQAIEAPGKHVLLTGPISGSVTKADGTVVDVTGNALIVDDQDEADEISFLIGEHWVEHGHPDDFEIDEDGNRVQRQFVHTHDKKFNKHAAKFSGQPAGKKD